MFAEEKTYKQNIIGFIEGSIPPEEFALYFQSRPQILDWLQSMVPDGMMCQDIMKVKLDFYLKRLPADVYEEITAAHKALCDAKDEAAEMQVELARRLVDLLSQNEAMLHQDLSIYLYNGRKVLNNPTGYQASYVAEWSEYVRRWFERDFIRPYDIPYDVYKKVPQLRGQGKYWYYEELQSWLHGLMQQFFPEEMIEKDKSIYKKAVFYTDVCPAYIDYCGEGITSIVEAIVAAAPDTIPKSERKKQIREHIKQAFYIEGNKYPRWIQGCDWPISKSGKPMRFLRQKQEKGKLYDTMLCTHFIFEDVDTGEITVIDQFT